MPCIKIPGGIVCVNRIIDMSPYGSKVWMEYHDYLWPTFFRSKNCITPIHTPSKKTWDAYNKWEKSRHETTN